MTAYENEVATYTAANPNSRALHERAKHHMPGGDTRNSIWWHPFPVYIQDAQGSALTDIDGNKRVDMVNNMTTLILGHKHPAVVKALHDQIERGVSFPAPSPPVVQWAEMLTERVASVDKIRFTNSGTEGTLNAIRAARAFTKRTKIAKCEGAYHGNHDAVQISVGPALDKAGDPLSPNPVADTIGIADSALGDIVIMPYNDIEACERVIRRHASELAAVIVEPVNGRSGMVPAKPGFLEALREITKELGIVLIFDEVIAFRISRGGAQEHFGVTPDLTCFGKTIGGGMPVGAFGGREDIMSLWDPGRPGEHVEHAGTFNGNPMTAAAGIATLEQLTPEVYADLARKGERLRSKLRTMLAEVEAPMGVTGVASLFALQFTTELVEGYRAYMTNDFGMRKAMFLGLLNEGFLMSNACAGNVSVAHTDEDIDAFVAGVRRVLGRMGYA